jgi:GNAT superfamily N-acetyltransferase
MSWKNPYAIIIDRYNNEDYQRLDNFLLNIEENERPFTINEVEKRLNIGHILFIAKKNDKIVGCFWVATNYIEVPFFHASIYLSKEEIVDYNSFVVKEHRGKRINSGLKEHAFHSLKRQGYKKAIGYIKTTNKSSLRANEHFGYHKIGEVKDLIFMTLEFRRHNISRPQVFFNGGVLRLWKGLYKKIKRQLQVR